MKNKIAIIGGGLFGITIYLILKKNGIDCTLFDKNKKILQGASSNNLNRVHFGYHYPRDYETAKQSLEGYKSFKKYYSEALIKNFPNYYFIAKSSKVNFSKYLKFCNKNKLKFNKTNLKKFHVNSDKLQGGIKVKEPIYDWEQISKIVNRRLNSLKNKKINLNEEVYNITYKKKYIIETNKKSYVFDKIIDASYEGSNRILKNIFPQKKNIYQQVIVFEFTSKDFKKMGLALMDGKFFSFLPKGKTNKHILYHVVHSVFRQKIANEFPLKWRNKKILQSDINKSKKKILLHISQYFPNLKLKLGKKYFLSSRVFPINLEKTDKRVSKIIRIRKGYYKILSAKVDHCVDIANEMLQSLQA